MNPLDEAKARSMLPELLQKAFQAYTESFGEQPHGTLTQMKGLMEFGMVKGFALELASARKEEAEECAKVAESEMFLKEFDTNQTRHNIVCRDIATTIRQRSSN